MTYKKKLIEVAIPLEAINAASAREKSIRHGHPSTLHLWWARRPLAACRAVLFAQLVDDPSSHPDQFPTHEDQERERQRLFAIIEDLVKWENSTNEEVLERARAEIRRSCGGVLPPVYDPFSGGGSIPLEAQRLGLPAYGSDLNPVAVMIGKAMIEIPPKFKDMPPIHPGIKERSFYRNAEGLAEDVKYYGEWMREKAWERIGHLYPQVDLPKEYGGGKATVIAWIWARTVPSPDPAFADVQVPIASSFMLNSKAGQEVWIEPQVDRVEKTISFRIRKGGTKAEFSKAAEGTKSGRGANFVCLLSGSAMTAAHITGAGKGGTISQTLIAIVAETKNGRVYVEPTAFDERIAASERPKWKPMQRQPENPRWFSPPAYGMETFADLFTDRQLIALTTLTELVDEVRQKVAADGLQAGLSGDETPLRDGGKGASAYGEAVSVYLGLAGSRLADSCNSICRWAPDKTQLKNMFSRQAIPMSWDFFEANPFAGAAGDFLVSATTVAKVLDRLQPFSQGHEINHDAQTVEYPKGTVISCDPPYYDNIGYADLSDFFYCWMKPNIQKVFPDVFAVLATPKSEELVATPYRHGGREAAERFFLDGMSRAIANMARCSVPAFGGSDLR